MTEKKLTKVQKFDLLLVVLNTLPESDEVTMLSDFIKHEQELLSKKSGKGAKNPKAEAEKAERVQAIQKVLLEADEPMRIKAIADETGFSSQRVTALVSQMVKAGIVTRDDSDKKAVTFSIE